MKATLTGDADRHCRVLDRKLALGQMMLTGQVNAENLGERLDETIQAIRETRNQDLTLKSGGALIVEMWEEVEAAFEEANRDFGTFAVYFDAINMDEAVASFRDRAAAFVSALTISSDGQYAIERVTDGVYLVSGDEKVVYSFTAKFGEATVYTSGSPGLRVLELKPEYATALVDNKYMRSVSMLLAQSMGISTDPFRTFLFAWTALEILINKAFSVYEQDLIDELTSKSTVPGTSRYLRRITEVMGDKYRLVDRFGVVASFLAGESSDEHIERFKKIKKVRDDIVHRGDVQEELLPNTELRALVTEYLRRHLDYVSPQLSATP
jgi:hypothetical protein